jgi:hypothetical protein
MRWAGHIHVECMKGGRVKLDTKFPSIPEGNGQLGKFRRTGNYNFKMYLKGKG